MKKTLILGITILLLSISSNACVMRVRGGGPFPVRFQVISGVRLLIVPAAVRVGDIVVINGNRCIVKKKHRKKIKVLYPNGTTHWVSVKYN